MAHKTDEHKNKWHTQNSNLISYVVKAYVWTATWWGAVEWCECRTLQPLLKARPTPLLGRESVSCLPSVWSLGSHLFFQGSWTDGLSSLIPATPTLKCKRKETFLPLSTSPSVWPTPVSAAASIAWKGGTIGSGFPDEALPIQVTRISNPQLLNTFYFILLSRNIETSQCSTVMSHAALDSPVIVQDSSVLAAIEHHDAISKHCDVTVEQSNAIIEPWCYKIVLC